MKHRGSNHSMEGDKKIAKKNNNEEEPSFVEKKEQRQAQQSDDDDYLVISVVDPQDVDEELNAFLIIEDGPDEQKKCETKDSEVADLRKMIIPDVSMENIPSTKVDQPTVNKPKSENVAITIFNNIKRNAEELINRDGPQKNPKEGIKAIDDIKKREAPVDQYRNAKEDIGDPKNESRKSDMKQDDKDDNGSIVVNYNLDEVNVVKAIESEENVNAIEKIEDVVQKRAAMNSNSASRYPGFLNLKKDSLKDEGLKFKHDIEKKIDVKDDFGMPNILDSKPMDGLKKEMKELNIRQTMTDFKELPTDKINELDIPQKVPDFKELATDKVNKLDIPQKVPGFKGLAIDKKNEQDILQKVSDFKELATDKIKELNIHQTMPIIAEVGMDKKKSSIDQTMSAIQEIPAEKINNLKNLTRMEDPSSAEEFTLIEMEPKPVLVPELFSKERNGPVSDILAEAKDKPSFNNLNNNDKKKMEDKPKPKRAITVPQIFSFNKENKSSDGNPTAVVDDSIKEFIDARHNEMMDVNAVNFNKLEKSIEDMKTSNQIMVKQLTDSLTKVDRRITSVQSFAPGDASMKEGLIKSDRTSVVMKEKQNPDDVLSNIFTNGTNGLPPYVERRPRGGYYIRDSREIYFVQQK